MNEDKFMLGRIETNIVSVPQTRASVIRRALQRGTPVDIIDALERIEKDLVQAASYIEYLNNEVGVRIPLDSEWNHWIKTKGSEPRKSLEERRGYSIRGDKS